MIEEADAGQSELPYGRALTALLLAECERLLGEPARAPQLIESLEEVPRTLEFELEQQRAHTLIVLDRVDEAHETITRMIELDTNTHGQETAGPFCAASDYMRAMGDHEAAVQLLANMLDGREPWALVHRQIINEGLPPSATRSTPYGPGGTGCHLRACTPFS